MIFVIWHHQSNTMIALNRLPIDIYPTCPTLPIIAHYSPFTLHPLHLQRSLFRLQLCLLDFPLLPHISFPRCHVILLCMGIGRKIMKNILYQFSCICNRLSRPSEYIMWKYEVMNAFAKGLVSSTKIKMEALQCTLSEFLPTKRVNGDTILIFILFVCYLGTSNIQYEL